MCNVYLRPPYGNELLHSGIKGQKWGVRRYQNPDGSLTAEGKRRYRSDVATRKKLESQASMTARIYADRRKRMEKQTLKYSKYKQKGTVTEKQRAKLQNAWQAEAYWKQKNVDAKKKLERHVDNMIKTYKDKKIKEISYVDTKYGKQVSGRILEKKDFGSAALASAVTTAVLLPTVGMGAVYVPSPRTKSAFYARRQEHAQGIKSPIWDYPKKLKSR